MKNLSSKPNDKTFNEAEEMTAVNLYNLFTKRRLLKKQLTRESSFTSYESLNVLREFEKLIDED